MRIKGVFSLNSISLEASKWNKPIVFIFIAIAVCFFILCEKIWNPFVSLIGLAFTLFGFWMTLKIYEIGQDFDKKLKNSVDSVSQVSLTAFKTQYLENLRFLRESSEKDSAAFKYWNFVWRFESFDILTVGLYEESENVNYRPLKIKIIGSNQNPFKVGFEGKIALVYIAEVVEEGDVDYKKNDRVYCSSQDRGYVLSKTITNIGIGSETIFFSIDYIGDMNSCVVTEGCEIYPRIISLKNDDVLKLASPIRQP